MLNKDIILARLNKYKVIDGECWRWSGSFSGGHRPTIKIKSKIYTVSRLSLFLFKDDFDLNNKKILACHNDKLCLNSDCWNPEHLYAGTYIDNAYDLVQSGNHGQTRKTHCPKGHSYKDSGIKRGGKRHCSECNKIKCKENYKKRKAKVKNK